MEMERPPFQEQATLPLTLLDIPTWVLCTFLSSTCLGRLECVNRELRRDVGAESACPAYCGVLKPLQIIPKL